MTAIDELLDHILTVAHEQAIELDDADQKARVEVWRDIQAGKLNAEDFEDESMGYDAALTRDAHEATVGEVVVAVARETECRNDLCWLLTLFHARRDATGWRVVMREYPPSPEDCERIGELAARYGVAVSVAQNEALEPEPVPDAPARDAEMPENPLDWLSELARKDD